jgi:glycosyltransferase involved in cell wall biosynthesis
MIHTWERKIHTIIVPSRFLKIKLASSSLKFPENDIVVKPNFVHDLPGPAIPREDFFLFVGRLSKEKGIDVLLDCFSRYPDKKLVIAGDGPEKERLLALIRNIPSITYAGLQPKDEILTLMKRCQALIFPSIWYEGLPLTIIEAFLTGTPVIGSRLGAMAEMIVDHYNGLHFDPGSPEDLYRSIREFSQSDRLREDLYRQARKSYEENYHPDIHYRSILNIYDTAINRR